MRIRLLELVIVRLPTLKTSSSPQHSTTSYWPQGRRSSPSFMTQMAFFPHRLRKTHYSARMRRRMRFAALNQQLRQPQLGEILRRLNAGTSRSSEYANLFYGPSYVIWLVCRLTHGWRSWRRIHDILSLFLLLFFLVAGSSLPASSSKSVSATAVCRLLFRVIVPPLFIPSWNGRCYFPGSGRALSMS